MSAATNDIISAASTIGLFIVLLFIIGVGGVSLFSHSRAREIGRDNWKAMVDNLQEQLDKQTLIINDLQQSNRDLSRQIVDLEKSDSARSIEISNLKSLIKTQGGEITELQNLLQLALQNLKAFLQWSAHPHGEPPKVSEALQGKINAI